MDSVRQATTWQKRKTEVRENRLLLCACFYIAPADPSCPRNVTAHPILKSIAGSIELRWTWTNATSATDPEPKPTGFLVRSSASGSCVGAVRSFDVDRTATNATLDGLRPYTVYNVCLVAVNGKFRRVCAERTTRTHTTRKCFPLRARFNCTYAYTNGFRVRAIL